MSQAGQPPLLLEAERPAPGEKARRARVLAGLAQARISNAWLRFVSSALLAGFTTAAFGDVLPLFWLAGFVPILLIERVLYRRVLKRCRAGDPPAKMRGLAAWMFFQSGYATLIAIIMWLGEYSHGETLAVIFLVGSLSNAAGTLRGSNALALATAAPSIIVLLGLPVVYFMLNGGRNPYDLMPLIGGIMFIAFGVNLWRSLRESDASQARAEVAALRERQSAASAAAAKSDTIQRMQDELRTPMSALIGAAEHLRRVATSPEARSHIATLAQAGEVLRLVLDDLSDLDRLENGQLRVTPEACDPRVLVRGVVDAFRAAAQDKRLELFLDIAPDVPPSVEIDAARVRQILFNLLANAVKYTTHGGVRVRLQAQAGGPGRVRLGFVVADTGSGMSRSQLALIFGRERAVAGQGGLGLAISQRLARLMGAKLAAKSEIGQGSVFSFVMEAPVAGAALKQITAA